MCITMQLLVAKVILFSVMSDCGCVQLSTQYLLNCLIYHHEFFTDKFENGFISVHFGS